MNLLKLEVNIQGMKSITAIEISKEKDAEILSRDYFSKKKYLNEYPVNPEKIENAHEDYIIFDCHLINIDNTYKYEHFYCALKK
ncbi:MULTISPECIES: hypothetical protein [unclassified Chryseobacterium]|uniref:hypothetical protein n=1 Tax=unclassified Chryseobacterium TaxID=2593645 RepID=UPI0028535BC7|nr:hypothetical protein [Chryseobacterium sp. CFS7]MDR4892260.1 hypothetical protein [Chryseobacterium sp. CFS7]